ncbi:MAG: hypothetical protein ACRDL7_10890, partial [Gaiellaceae bacterium]
AAARGRLRQPARCPRRAGRVVAVAAIAVDGGDLTLAAVCLRWYDRRSINCKRAACWRSYRRRAAWTTIFRVGVGWSATSISESKQQETKAIGI